MFHGESRFYHAPPSPFRKTYKTVKDAACVPFIHIDDTDQLITAAGDFLDADTNTMDYFTLADFADDADVADEEGGKQ